MKLKFVFAAFIAVAMMASCAEQAIVDEGENGGGLDSQKTTATFTLNLKNPDTRSWDFDPDPGSTTGTPAVEQIINPDDVRLMIFDDATGILEANTLFTGAIANGMDGSNTTAWATVVVTSGLKKIYVFANTSNIPDNPLSTFLVQSSTLTDFENDAVFDAQIPQFLAGTLPDRTDPTERTFDFTPLYEQYDDGTDTFGLPASTTNQFSYSLAPNVTLANSTNPTQPPEIPLGSNTYSQINNNFKISMVYMVAKARLTFDDPSILNTTDADIYGLTYAIHNLARKTNYVLNVVANAARSWYHQSPAWTWVYANTPTAFVAGTPPHGDGTVANHYLNHMDAITLANRPVNAKPSTVTTTGFLYVPESSNGTGITLGECPYYAIKATYRPLNVVYKVGWDQVSLLNMATAPLAEIENGAITADPTFVVPTTDLDFNYVKILMDITGQGGTITAGTYFKNISLLAQAAWLVVNGSGSGAGGWVAGPSAEYTAGIALLGATPPATPDLNAFLAYPQPVWGHYIYTDAASWFRANIGGQITSPQPSGFGPAPLYGIPKWGTIRGIAYDANITEIKGSGKPYEWMLDTEKPDPVESDTYITVVVEILNWAHATQSNVIIQ